MRFWYMSVVAVVACIAGGCGAAGRQHATAADVNGGVVRELRDMAKADQLSRTPPNETDPAADERRQHRVLELLAGGMIQDPESQERAALILQHAGLTICDGKLTAFSRDDYLLAHLLAKSAAEKDGRPRAPSRRRRWIGTSSSRGSHRSTAPRPCSIRRRRKRSFRRSIPRPPMRSAPSGTSSRWPRS